MSVKTLLKKSSLVMSVFHSIQDFRKRDILCRRAEVRNEGTGHYHKDIEGNGNLIMIRKGVKMNHTTFHIAGNNNTIEVGENCRIGRGCSFWMEGDGINIRIGRGTSFVQQVHFNAQEDGTEITVGEDCMFSNHIIVRTSDSHPIYDTVTGQRINPARNVRIGNHVWIAPDSKVMKGAVIGDGSIIGSNSMVTREIPPGTLAVGAPADVKKQNVCWTREDIIHKKG